MPELPEVETIRRELEPLITGKTFAAPILHMPSTIEHPAPEEFSGALQGRTVKKIGRKGKYLLIYLDQGILVVHLRMTGNLIYTDDSSCINERFLRVTLPFSDRSSLVYSDMRRFGRLWYVSGEAELKELVLQHVGPDIYNELDCETFQQMLKKKEKSRLKSLLLDQDFAAGMGNIYTDECLHRCGFHPLRRVSSLNRDETKALYHSIKAVLEEGIEHGGTTFRDYRSASGALGDFQSRLAVYGRKGENCIKCGALIEKTVVAGRGTYYCPCCQVNESEEDREN
ncbi:MAG: DNA-formamidopyrimidine glycosylase [Firmicutes bacterium]|nr:DNA-formamidopyrimidine glycosylase [Bacillota bacterium]